MIAASPRSVPSALSAGPASLKFTSLRHAALLAALALAAPLACAAPTPTPESEKADAPPPPKPSEAQFSGTKKPDPTIADPPWFSPAIFPAATVTKKGRSPADDQGRFTAQILFTLPDGATLTDCTDPIAKAVEGAVPQLGREEQGDRITLRGAANDYEVVAMCGPAKGKMTAFVSYRWTAATTSQP